MKIIGIACGGFTSEREISLKSGNLIFNLIKNSKFECFKIDINKSNFKVIDKFENNYSLNEKKFQFFKNDVRISFDYIINLVHGSPGEDGNLTKKFEDLGISHSTCSSLLIEEGEFNIMSLPLLFFVKAIKSLIDSFPFKMATSLSKPIAIPPWGGAP